MKLQPTVNGWISLMCDGIVVNKVRVCARCGELVDKWVGEFSTPSARYRMCGECMAITTQDLIDGKFAGSLAYEDWDKNLEKQRVLESALLSYHMKSVE